MDMLCEKHGMVRIRYGIKDMDRDDFVRKGWKVGMRTDLMLRR